MTTLRQSRKRAAWGAMISDQSRGRHTPQFTHARAAAQAGSNARGKQESGGDMQRVVNEAWLR